MTDDECRDIYNAAMEQPDRSAVSVTRAIEQAVIKKLSEGVSVEPAATMQTYPDGRRRVLLKGSVADCDAQWQTTHILYTATAIAAARVASLEEAAKIAETPIAGEQDDITMEAKDRVADAIRALIGGQTCTSDEWLSNCPQSVRDLANKIKKESA